MAFLAPSSNSSYDIREQRLVENFNHLYDRDSMLFSETDAEFLLKELYTEQLISNAFTEGGRRKSNYLKFVQLAERFPDIQNKLINRLKLYVPKSESSEVINIAQELKKIREEMINSRNSAIKEELKKYASGDDYKKTENIIFSQWDEASRIEMQKDIKIVGLLHQDVMNGMFANLQPIVNRLKSQSNGNKTSLELYAEASQEFYKEERKQKFLATLKEIEKNESAIRAKLKWCVETQSEKKLQLVSVTNNSKKAKKLKAEIEYLDAEVKDLSFWINALDNKRNIEKQTALRNEQERIAAEKRQEMARNEAYLRAIAEAAQRQARAAEEAASDARWANTMNSLNNEVNQMNQDMMNLINSYKSPYSTPYRGGTTTFQRFGNSIYGTDGTNCQTFGNTMYCR